MSEEKLKLRDHVVWRGKRLYFRRRTPLDLLPDYGGKVEFLESLKTSDVAEANRKALVRSLELEQEFNHKRAMKVAPVGDCLSNEEVERIAKLWAADALESDEFWRANGNPWGTEEHRETIEWFLPDYAEAYANGDISHALGITRQELRRHGIKLAEDSSSFRSLALAILAELIRVSEAQLKRMDGVPIPTPKVDPVVRVQPPKVSSARLSDLLDTWKLQKKRRKRTEDEARFTVEQFERINGEKPAAHYVKADAVNFRDTLLREGKTKPATVRKKMNLIAPIFAAAAADGKIAVNPFDGVTRPEAGDEPQRHPYSLADLQRIFTAPVYADPAYRPTGGAGEAAYWLPLLALWTGARLEELGQLLDSDVREDDGIAYLNLKPEGGDKRFKNRGSQREVPLHAELMRLGFLSYVKDVRSNGGGRLFPRVRSSGSRQITASFSQWWGRYARDVVGITDPAKTFHSFRHSFADAAKNNGVPRDIRFALMGHTAHRATGDDYGNDYARSTLAAYMGKVRYPGLELSHLAEALSASGNASRSVAVEAA